MKKILFSLIALVCSMSMNAQVMKIMKGSDVVDTYKGADYKVVFEEEPSYLLSGSFSVSADKKVKFTKSNLYWNGSAWKFEAKPTDYPTTRATTHVGHFYWTKTAAASYAASYSDGTNATTDKFFADGSDAGHTLTAEGVSGLYILSAEEWNNLLKGRDNASNLHKYGVTVNGKANCLVIAPDGFTGTLKATYTLEELETAGLVCLPAAGDFDGTTKRDNDMVGSYWSSTPSVSLAGGAQNLAFEESKARVREKSRGSVYCLRAVVAEKPTSTGPEYVEIGGKKWATMNLGATTVAGSLATCAGDYYQWGSVNTLYSSVSWSGTTPTFTWKSGKESGYITASNTEYTDDTDLPDAYDVVKQNIGDGWRMPTKADFEALHAACSSSYELTALTAAPTQGGVYRLAADQEILPEYTGVAGILYVDKNNPSKRVFFPAAGFVNGTNLSSGYEDGRYWSTSFDMEEYDGVHILLFTPKQVSPSRVEYRDWGYTVRPVKD